ncbi:MAG: YceI family protein [Leptonema sp. (in: bacteria)]
MRKLIFKWVGVSLLWSMGLWANSYTIDYAHNKVGFEVSHLMLSTVDGKFNYYEAIFEYDSKTNILKNIKVKIKAQSIDTENEKRDKHLRSEDFLDVKKYPYIEFVSTEELKIKPGETKQLKGKLTIKGISKDIVLDVKFVGKMSDPMKKKERIGFTAETKINRFDFGINWNDMPGAVGDEVRIIIKGEGLEN